MTVYEWSLSAGLAVAGIGAVTAAALLRGGRRKAAEQNASAEERAALALQRRNALQRRLAVIALGIGCLMMFALAGIAAWLSFGAQREYAHAHNGGDWDAATGFALLLDAGALSLSLIRFFEALSLRSSAITRILLLAFVSASAGMNLLHAPGEGFGSAFLAVVPPLVYAILLEMLLFKIEQVVMGRQKRRKTSRDRDYSLLLWLPWPIGAPVKMWRAWRSELLATVDNVRVIGSQRPRPSAAAAAPAAEVIVERGVPVATRDTAEAPASIPQTTTENAEEALSSEVTPPAVPASTPAIPPADAEEPATTDGLKVPEPTAVAEPRPAVSEPAAAPETEAVPEPKAAPGPGAEQVPEREQEPGEAVEATVGEPVPHGDQDAEDEKEEEPRHDTPPEDQEDEEVREQLCIEIDLSVLPRSLTQRQRAERIYVAHQAAGVALPQADLGRWAGYKNPNSGGNEYRRLEKEHGPIVVREGATHVDLSWSHEPVAA
ncbi:DUF2637 domain-containing protein [Streptomyces clavuligerus]|uniref:DUF2637 domain-containing protein n=1 Tax=Streptomyces clavuligerus TaxID=1901 RepID=UPI00017FF63E|nr:DUF2637 domain-containing protein [Streptomyces clavuligerus]EDY49241.1 hypothetical protein SSCG_02269 [Streptomyces clavuligerus]WDN56150.1 DUF2637 domain-containing protein [Streptomyces clavuligerus]